MNEVGPYRLVLPFWYQLTLVVLDKGPLNGCLLWFCVVDLACYQSLSISCHCSWQWRTIDCVKSWPISSVSGVCWTTTASSTQLNSPSSSSTHSWTCSEMPGEHIGFGRQEHSWESLCREGVRVTCHVFIRCWILNFDHFNSFVQLKFMHLIAYWCLSNNSSTVSVACFHWAFFILIECVL